MLTGQALWEQTPRERYVITDKWALSTRQWGEPCLWHSLTCHSASAPTLIMDSVLG